MEEREGYCDCGTMYVYGYLEVHMNHGGDNLYYVGNYSDDEYYYCPCCGDKDLVVNRDEV
jgi:hypothetical protein